MKKARLAAQSREHLDERLKDFGSVARYSPPVRGWIRAIREALGLTTQQVARRLGIKQPSAVALEQSEAKGSIELATLRRVADALGCTLVYAFVPKKSLEETVRARARARVTSCAADGHLWSTPCCSKIRRCRARPSRNVWRRHFVRPARAGFGNSP